MKYTRWLLPVIPVAVFLLAWQMLSRVGVINTSLFPAPTAIAHQLANLHGGGTVHSVLWAHIAASLRRVFMSFAIGAAAGILIGILMGTSKWVSRLLDPLITVAMPIPGIALAPLFIIWFGFGDPTIIAVGTIAAFFPLAYNTAVGVRSIDLQLIRAARIMGLSKASLLYEVYLPWAAAYILTGVKLGLARCWRTVIAVEFIAAANWGLGYMIWDASEYLRTGIVYGGIALLMAIYLALEKLVIVPVENHTVKKWGMVKS